MNTVDLIETLSHDVASARIHWLSLLSATLLTGAMSAGFMLVFVGFRLDGSNWQAQFSLAIKLLLATTVLLMALHRLRIAGIDLVFSRSIYAAAFVPSEVTDTAVHTYLYCASGITL